MSEVGYREKCFEEKGEKCKLCGSENGVLAHHINGDRTDDHIGNLMPVCQSCHKSIHHKGGENQQWTNKLPKSAKIHVGVDELRPREVDVLGALSDGRANPEYIRRRTGLPKTVVTGAIKRITRDGLAKRVVPGLYEITAEGREHC